MTKASDNDFPSLLYTEQSSAPSNPAASHQRVYIRTSDHHLVRVNSSGTVTDVEAGSGGLSSGTSFPGSPSSGDIFYRSDLHRIAFYDGTRWLSIELYRQSTSNTDQLQPFGTFPVDLGRMQIGNVGTNNYYVEKVILSTYHTGTVNGSNYVTVTANIAGSSIGSTNTSADTTATWTGHTITVNALAGTTSRELELLCTKTGSPSSMFVLGTVEYRTVMT